MKKIILFLCACLLLGLLAACNREESIPSSSSANTEGSHDWVLESNDITESIDPLEREIDQLQEELATLREELQKVNGRFAKANDDLEEAKEKVVSLESNISELESKLKKYETAWVVRSIPFGSWDSLLLVEEQGEKHGEDVLYLRYHSGEMVEITRSNINMNGYIVPAPDGKYIAFNNYSWEYNTPIYLYNMETKETRTLPTSLPEDETPSAMCWLDSRYLLFVCQFDHGTIVQGGDVYYYDIETDQHGKIIETDDPGMLQINDFHRYDDFMMLTATQLEEEYLDPIDDKYFTVPYEQIYNLIETGELLVLKSDEGIS